MRVVILILFPILEEIDLSPVSMIVNVGLSYMSFIMPPETLPRQIDCKVSGLDNLFLATQWQRSPGGLPIAAECGRMAVKEICAVEKRRAQPESAPRGRYVGQLGFKG